MDWIESCSDDSCPVAECYVVVFVKTCEYDEVVDRDEVVLELQPSFELLYLEEEFLHFANDLVISVVAFDDHHAEYLRLTKLLFSYDARGAQRTRTA